MSESTPEQAHAEAATLQALLHAEHYGPGEALVIPLAGLPAGTQIAIQIVIGPPDPPAPEPAPQAPTARRYATGAR